MAEAVVRARVDADTTSFERGISRVSSSLGALKSTIATAFSVGAVAGFARSVIQFADNIKDAADQAGVGIETYQALGIAFQRAGSSADRVVGILARLQDAQITLREGGAAAEKLAQKLADIGINAQAFENATIDDMVEMLARASGEADIFGAAFELVGVKQAPAMIAALREMKGGLAEFTEEAKKSGEVLDAYATSTIARVQDAFDSFGRRLKVFAAEQWLTFTNDIEKAGAFWGAILGQGSFGDAIGEMDQRDIDEYRRRVEATNKEQDRRDAERRDNERRAAEELAAKDSANAQYAMDAMNAWVSAAAPAMAEAVAKATAQAPAAAQASTVRAQYDQLVRIGAIAPRGAQSRAEMEQAAIKAATERTAKATEKIAENVNGGGSVF